MKKRIAWIDTAKGIGILLVVLGHTMSPVMTGYREMEVIYKVLYTFHMPLFFFLAGIVSNGLLDVEKGARITRLLQRCRRLLIPYFVWAAIYIPMKALMKEHVRFEQTYGLWTILLGNNPAGQLWFLYVLFVLSVITIFLVTRKNLRVWCGGAMAISFLAPLIPDELHFPGIGLFYSLYQIGFFFWGLILSNRREGVNGKGIVAIICTVVCAIYTVSLAMEKECWYLMAVAAASFCYLICVAAVKPCGKIKSLLIYLGSRSMHIYILHAPLLVVGRMVLRPLLGECPFVYAILLTIGAITVSLLVSELIIKKVFILRLSLFGEK